MKGLVTLGLFEPFGAALLASSGEKQHINRPDACAQDSYFLAEDAHLEPVGAGLQGHESETYVSDTQVVWSSGRHIRKRFTGSGSIRQAVWCSLDGENEPVLALLADCITTYATSGAIHTVPLSFEPAAIWPVPHGLLVQVAPSQVTAPSDGGQASTSSSSGSFRAPAALLSLLHPLEDLQGVYEASGAAFADPHELVIWSSSTVSYLVTHHAVNQRHSIWKVHPPAPKPSETPPSFSPLWTPPLPNAQTSETPAYLLPIEEPPVVSVTRIWTQTSTGKRASRVVYAHDEDGTDLLCLLIRETESLVLLRVPKSDGQDALLAKERGLPRSDGGKRTPDSGAVSVLGVLPAAAAVAVEGTRRNFIADGAPLLDLVVLSRDGSLMLHMGAYPICQLSLPGSPTTTPPSTPMPRVSDDSSAEKPSEVGNRTQPRGFTRERPGVLTRRAKEAVTSSATPSKPSAGAKVTSPATSAAATLVDLRDPVRNRVNVVFVNGSTMRVAVKVAPESPLVAACLLTLALVLPATVHRFLVGQWLGESFKSVARAPGNDVEWDLFAGLVRRWVKGALRLTQEGVTRVEEARSVKKGAEAKKKGSGGVGSGSGRSSEENPPTDWEFLLRSDLCKAMLDGASYRALEIPRPAHDEVSPRGSTVPASTESFPSAGSPKSDKALVRSVLEALHLVYEDLKLDTLKWRSLHPLATLLHSLATSLDLPDYQDYYSREWSDLPSPGPISPISVLQNLPFPLDLHGLLCNILAQPAGADGQAGPFDPLPDLLTSSQAPTLGRSRQTLALYDIIASEKSLRNVHGAGRTPTLGIPVKLTRGTARSAAHSVVLVMVSEGMSLSDLDRLPSGVALPIRQALYTCQESPPADWPAPAFVLIGREDLATARLGTLPESPPTTTSLMTPPYAHHLRPVESSEPAEAFENFDDNAEDGMAFVSSARARAHFREDLRLEEVRRLLNSANPVAVRVTGGPELADPDLVAHQQALLWQLAQRTTALPAGRGAFSLATAPPVLTEALPLPKLVLAGRLPAQQNATVNLDVNAGQSLTDLTTWPEFHNGVAAGLRLAPGQTKITRTWITYNTPETPTPAHAGVLMALGLQGHLRILAATEIYRYLAQEHDVTTVGVLLGMAAAHRGTLNPVISKMLYLHIPARHPPSFPELELPPLVQSAALLAVGLLYQGSAHRLTTEILLAEIGRKPGIDAAVDREGYALSAGLALGLVCLGRGNEAVGLADLHIEDRLHHYLAGGSEGLDNSRARELALGLPRSDEFETAGEQILEGDMVNVDVTAPGATLALALMFLRTNNRTVAARLKIPDTHFDLEYVRPDFILLRVLARGLILWDGVLPTEAWVSAQIPEIVRKSAERKGGVFATIEEDSDEKSDDVDTEALAQAHVNILAGACFAIGLRFAGTGNEDARALLHKYAMQFLQQKRGAPTVSAGDSKRVDKGTLETCLNVALLSLSVVMAGTGHLPTLRLLRQLRRRMPGEGEVSHGNHVAVSMALGFLFMGGGARTFATSNEAVAALVVALYPRFPQAPNDHRCHLQAFRHLYVLATEDRCVEAVDVDTNQPVFVPLEITVSEPGQHSETTYTRVTPCLLPERAHLKRVKVSGPRYWPHVIDLQSSSATSSRRQSILDLNAPPHPDLSDQDRQTLGLGVGTVAEGLVAAKAARLHPSTPGGSGSSTPGAARGSRHDNLRRSKDEDPDLAAIDGRMRTLYVKRKAAGAASGMLTSVGQGLTSAGLGAEADWRPDPLSGLSADPSIVAFSDHFCTPSDPSSDGREFASFCAWTLRECMTSEVPAVVHAYLDFYTSVNRIAEAVANGETVDGRDCLAVANLKVALAFCSRFDHVDESLSAHVTPLIRPSFLMTLHKRIERALDAAQLEGPDSPFGAYLKPHTLSGRAGPSENWRNPTLGLFLGYHDIPTVGELARVRQQFGQLGANGLDASMKVPVLSLLMPRTSQHSVLKIAASM